MDAAQAAGDLAVRLARYPVMLVVMTVATLLLTPAIIVLSLAGLPDPAQGLTRLWCRILLVTSGVRARVSGAEHLPPDPAYVIISNHASHFDGPALVVHLPHPPYFVIKRELARIPLWGHAAVALGYIPIDRHDPDSAHRQMQAAVDAERSGRTVVVFAEGTRSRDGCLQSFKKGGFHLALDAGVPVVPVAIRGSRCTLPKGSWVPRPGLIEIEIGPQIPTCGLARTDIDDLLQRTRAEVERRLHSERRLSGPPE